MYGLAFAGKELIDKLTDNAANEGFKVIRCWAFEDVNYEDLHFLCDKIKSLDMKLILCLADRWGFLQSYKIDDEWYKNEYKNKYLTHVKNVIREFKHRDEIMVWELINEPETSDYEVFKNFVKDVSEVIKNISPSQLVSLGTIGGIGDKLGSVFSVFNHKKFKDLYSINTLDCISVHDYSYDAGIFERLDIYFRFKDKKTASKITGVIAKFFDAISKPIQNLFVSKLNRFFFFPVTLRGLWNIYSKFDYKTSKELKKPIYVGEVGFKKKHKELRKKILEIDIEKKFSNVVSGYILWSFESMGYNPDGHDYGFDESDGFKEVIKKFNS